MKKTILDVYSPLEGVVKFVLKTPSDYGYRVYVTYKNCILMFAHLSEIFVKEGQTVDAGTVLGLMGNTGYGGDVHLHVSAFNKRAQKLTAEYAMDPTFILKLAKHVCTNTLVSNPYGSKYCNPKLKSHEGIDFSGHKPITGWDTDSIGPLHQDYLLQEKHPEFYN